MPTITHPARANIGGNPAEFTQPRAQLKASTGMSIPPSKEATSPELGQPGIKEETTPQAVTLSPQLTALARKQQKLQQEIQSQRDKETAWAAERADYIPKGTFKAKLQENAAAALQDLGLDYNELTDLLLKQQQSEDPVKRLESEINKLKQSQEENVNKQYEATLKQYKAEVSSLVTADPKAFFFIHKEGHQDAVVQHIVETWKENPDEVLTVEQAAKEIEEVLREEAKAKAAALKELEPDPVDPEEKPTAKTLPPPKQAARTLTQQVESTPTRTYNQFQHLSHKERIAQSIARAQK